MSSKILIDKNKHHKLGLCPNMCSLDEKENGDNFVAIV